VSVSDRLFKRYYANQSRSGTVLFYGRLRQAFDLGAEALNVGAGPGDPVASEVFVIRDLRGLGRRVCGCDPDAAVLGNAQLDEARVMAPGGAIPYENGRFQIVYADYVLEHVERPGWFLDEVHRVLKPGGRFFFRTPNLYHYVSAAARVLPHSVHRGVANRARGLEQGAHEPYPTLHRMNTRRALRKLGEQAGFTEVHLEMVEGEPSYLMFNAVAFLLGVAYERTVNASSALSGLRANIIGSMVK